MDFSFELVLLFLEISVHHKYVFAVSMVFSLIEVLYTSFIITCEQERAQEIARGVT